MSDKKKKKTTSTGGITRPSPMEMARLFEACDLKLTDEQLKRFWKFHQLLRARNEELDLTRLHNFEAMVLKHYVDSAMITTLIDLPAPLLDIGAGAGFPGIPLKIMRPDLPVTLAESRGKRLAFMEEAIELLNLDHVDVYPHKVTSHFDRPVGGIITRDLEAIGKTLERASGFLPSGGLAIFMKGPSADEELATALDDYGSEFELVADRSYRLGQTDLQRRLIVVKRTSIAAMVNVPRTKERAIREIASDRNPIYKTWQKILEPRGIRKHGLALVAGMKNVQETVNDFPDIVKGLIDTRDDDPMVETGTEIPRYRLRPELFRRLDLFGAGPPLLLVQIPDFTAWSDDNWPDGCTVFIGFQDPANVGALIRTATALGAARVVLLEEAAHPFHPRSLRAAGPTAFRIPLLTGPSIQNLSSNKVPLLSLGINGVNVMGYNFPKSFGLVPGVEGPGLPDHLKNSETLCIPMAAGVESLNAATATAIVLYEWKRGILL